MEEKNPYSPKWELTLIFLFQLTLKSSQATNIIISLGKNSDLQYVFYSICI